MAKVTLELPDEVAAQVQEMLKRLETTTKAAQAADGTPFDANAALGAITEATTADPHPSPGSMRCGRA